MRPSRFNASIYRRLYSTKLDLGFTAITFSSLETGCHVLALLCTGRTINLGAQKPLLHFPSPFPSPQFLEPQTFPENPPKESGKFSP